MPPDEQARTLLALWLDEREAVEGARISHGEIRARFEAAADHHRRRREEMWRGARDPYRMVVALLALAGDLLDSLTGIDPEHRSARGWLERDTTAPGDAAGSRRSADDGNG